MKRSSEPRRTANLSQSVHKQLNMYALAASAAGVGMLALAQPADAKIVYTPAYTKLPLDAYLYLDLNHDGVNDFKFFLSYYSGKEGWVHALSVQGVARADQVWWTKTSRYYCAAALPKGALVRPKAPFLPGKFLMFQTGSGGYGGPYCTWGNATTPYLGLKFSINGKVHYGWARVGNIRKGSHKPAATLIGYAYETIPNKAIVAGKTNGPDDGEPTGSFTTPTPEPATLGALAMGAPGLSIWRRKETVLQGN